MKPVTVTLVIGNSDDKLPQSRWADFLRQTDHYVNFYSVQIFFSGFSKADVPWQNAAWVFLIYPANIPQIMETLKDLRAKFDQESVAWVQGQTQFL